MNSMLLKHEQPAVLSAVMKYETTSRVRVMANDAMDIMGGFGLSRGPGNYSGNAYMNLPIAITVEGANILTRSLIIFGQGLVRSHPNLINIINSIEKGDDVQGFRSEVLQLVGHAVRNGAISLSKNLTRPRNKSPGNLLEYYEGQFARLAANFAVCSDLALVLGGRLKVEEMLSGRFADAFGTLYLAYACMWNYRQNAALEGIDDLFEMTMESLLQENQVALHGISMNFPVSGIGTIMRLICFPVGLSYQGPSDDLLQKVSASITNPSAVRELLTKGTFISQQNTEDKHFKLEQIFAKSVEADKILSSCKKGKRSMTVQEEELVKHCETVINDIIQVDEFPRLGAEILQVMVLWSHTRVIIYAKCISVATSYPICCMLWYA